MPENDELPSVSLKDQQRVKLKEIGLEGAIVGEIAGMWVLEGPVYLYDTREARKYAECNMRVILGNDIDPPLEPERFASQYPFPVDTPTLALSDIVDYALARVTGLRGHTPFPHSLEDSNEIIGEIIDRSKKQEGVVPAVTVVTVEGSIWEGKHTFQPDPSISFYTEQLLEKIKEDYKTESRPLIFLASCNQKGPNGQVVHATITPPAGVDLVYVKGLASIYHGNGNAQFVKGPDV